MAELNESEVIVTRYVRGDLTLTEAADELIALTRRTKAAGGDARRLSVRPVGELRSPEAAVRAEALFAELDRRAALG